jgi:adenosylcobinamide-phosphate synthase
MPTGLSSTRRGLTGVSCARMVRPVEAALYPGLLALGCAALMDAWVRLPSEAHPVAWFGRLAQWLIDRAPTSPDRKAFRWGLAIALCLPTLAALATWFVLRRVAPWYPALFALQIVVLYACVCLFGLLQAAQRLGAALDQGLPEARKQLSWLCSRDPTDLDEPALLNGAIESLAENLSDSVVAPLFFLCCGGLPCAVLYRAVNTLDAMIGYRGRYEWLGKAAAKLDDFLNYVPARLTAWLLWLAAASCSRSQRLDLARGRHTWRRDHARTPSPNGGHPMAMAAGLLGVRLDKPGSYVLGEAFAVPARADLPRTLTLTRRAGLLAWVIAAGLCAWRGGHFFV